MGSFMQDLAPKAVKSVGKSLSFVVYLVLVLVLLVLGLGATLIYVLLTH